MQETPSSGDIKSVENETPANANEHRSKEETYWKRQVFWSRWTAIFAALAFLAAATYAYFAHQQVTTMIETLHQTQIAASATATQAAIADEAMRVSNRPYVQISSRRSWEWRRDAKGKPVGVQLYLENAGNTPAEQTIACGGVANATPKKMECQHLEIHPRRIEMPIYGGQERKGTTIYKSTVGPVIPAHETVPIIIFNITPEEIKKGLADKPGFIVMGSFEYMNVFDEYCCEPFEIILEKGNFVAEPPWGRSVACPDDRPNVCEPKSEKYPVEK